MNTSDNNLEFRTSACAAQEAALEDYVSGELSSAGEKQLIEHLATCHGCTEALAEAQVAARMLRAAEPTADPGAGFSRIAMARIRGEMENQEERSIWRPFVSLAWKLSATAALALVMLVGFDARQQGSIRTQNELAIVAANEAPELLSDEARQPSNRDETLILMAEEGHAKQ
ncbi:MAG TPA: zf-HC2 domain-containing protein [Candidatus Acidoferrales bacterium]